MSEETQSRQLVIFTLGAEDYALPIKKVQEIIRYTEPRSVASNDSSVRGVISLRGKIVPRVRPSRSSRCPLGPWATRKARS